MREDAEGQLTVLVLQPRVRGETDEPPKSRFEVYETILESIDPEQGRLIGTRTIPECAIRILDDTHVATYSEPAGVPVLVIWRFRIQ